MELFELPDISSWFSDDLLGVKNNIRLAVAINYEKELKDGPQEVKQLETPSQNPFGTSSAEGMTTLSSLSLVGVGAASVGTGLVAGGGAVIGGAAVGVGGLVSTPFYLAAAGVTRAIDNRMFADTINLGNVGRFCIKASTGFGYENWQCRYCAADFRTGLGATRIWAIRNHWKQESHLLVVSSFAHGRSAASGSAGEGPTIVEVDDI